MVLVKTKVVGLIPMKQLPINAYSSLCQPNASALKTSVHKKSTPPLIQHLLEGKIEIWEWEIEREWAARGSDMCLREYLTGIEKAREKNWPPLKVCSILIEKRHEAATHSQNYWWGLSRTSIEGGKQRGNRERESESARGLKKRKQWLHKQIGRKQMSKGEIFMWYFRLFFHQPSRPCLAHKHRLCDSASAAAKLGQCASS